MDYKKASVEKDCQVYHLVNEYSFPCLRVCGFYDDYLEKIALTMMQTSNDAFVFPHTYLLSNGKIKVDWFKCIEQIQVRRQLHDIIESTPSLPIGITLHSMRHGVLPAVAGSTKEEARKHNIINLDLITQYNELGFYVKNLCTIPQNTLRSPSPGKVQSTT